MFARQKNLIVTLITLLVVVLSACNAPTAPASSSETVLTQAAGTAIVRLTEAAALLPSATVTPTTAPTETAAPPTATTAPLPTQEDAQPQPTNTQAPANNPPASTTQDGVNYVADVDYPDGTVVNPGETFTKTWRIKNTGATTWTTAYNLVCIDPGKLKCPESVNIPNDVKSGETIDIKVTLTAPDANGSYKAFFRMRNAAGQFFKLDGGGDLWVQINVGQAAPTATSDPNAAKATNTPDGSAATPTNTVEPTVTPTETPAN